MARKAKNNQQQRISVIITLDLDDEGYVAWTPFMYGVQGRGVSPSLAMEVFMASYNALVDFCKKTSLPFPVEKGVQASWRRAKNKRAFFCIAEPAGCGFRAFTPHIEGLVGMGHTLEEAVQDLRDKVNEICYEEWDNNVLIKWVKIPDMRR